jgi:uncharacterized protein YbbC (DUF1343 family)
VGRGSEAAFEQIGAPWLDTTAVLAAIRQPNLPGVRFRGVEFTPNRPGDGKFADTLVYGIRLQVTNRSTYDPTTTAVHLLSVIRRVHADRFVWVPAHFDRLAGGLDLREGVQAGRPAEEIVQSWGRQLERFRSRRTAFLVYPDDSKK